jgi:hydroxyacylglutathione hydrolase
MPVVTIEVPALGNRSHVVHDGTVAVAIDPPRDLTAVERAAEEAEVDVVAVADTHVHNDYVSGGLTLARRHGADYLLSADEPVSFERVGVHGGDALTYGPVRLEVLSTPGHTRHHQSFLARVPGEPAALLSGGSLLLGTVGRTDLVDPRLALHLAGLQWDSAVGQLGLAADTLLLPTHGFGSFCAATAVDSGDQPATPDPTLGGQRSHPALAAERAAFSAALVAAFGPIPAYYPHMDPINRAGAGTPRPTRAVTAADVDAAIAAGSWVVDVRARDRHADGHLAGTVGVEYSDQFATYVGWLVPWGADLLLLTDRPDQLAPAVTDLAGIGIEGVGVHVLEAGSRLEARYRRADWAAYAAERDRTRPVVVDVRQRNEYAEGHLPGAIHVPVQVVERSAAALPPGELWVHCRSGYRAGIAASLLHRQDRDVVHLDDRWERVAELGIETIPAAA